jgi:hypothetical protein
VATFPAPPAADAGASAVGRRRERGEFLGLSGREQAVDVEQQHEAASGAAQALQVADVESRPERGRRSISASSSSITWPPRPP